MPWCSLTGHELESQTVFTVYSVFNALQFTVATLPYGIKCVTEARVSFKKMEVGRKLGSDFLHKGHGLFDHI